MRVRDILEMNTAEFAGWVAFYKWEAQENQKAMQKSNLGKR